MTPISIPMHPYITESDAASFGALDDGVEGKNPADFGAALLRSSVDRNDSTSS